MDDLFSGHSSQETTSSALSLFPQEERRPEARPDEDKRGGKGFTSQLDAFLAEAFEQVAEEIVEERERSSSRGRRPLSGLDLLIRPTAEAPAPAAQGNKKRRLTLAFSKEQLEQLKAIARQEGIYLKDLINQLIESYITSYEKGKGKGSKH
jgi:hypothetical protein